MGTQQSGPLVETDLGRMVRNVARLRLMVYLVIAVVGLAVFGTLGCLALQVFIWGGLTHWGVSLTPVP
jgi:hypothetical protein